MAERISKKTKRPIKGLDPWQVVLAEIEAALAERDEEKSAVLWAAIDTEKLLAFIDNKTLDMEVLAVKVKFVSVILKGRIVKPQEICS